MAKTNNNQPYTRIYNGKRYRKFLAVTGLQVADDGKSVVREHKSKSKFTASSWHYHKIFADKEGNLYIRTNTDGNFRVDFMVATCFCPPAKDGSRRYVKHKDGNKNNCDYRNLEWITRAEYRQLNINSLSYVDSSTGEIWVWSKGDFYVTASGKVRHGKTDMQIEHLIDDPDVAALRAASPYVSLGWQSPRESVEDLVADALCTKLQGVVHQVLLHVDYNFLNCEASNLKWVDANDPEYAKYCEQRKKDVEAINLQYSTLP